MFDAVIGLGACDKTLPGLSLALARLNIPGFLLYGGTILPGEVNGQEATVRSVYEKIGAYKAGKISEEELKLFEDHACPTHGACGGQYTANTMAMAMEFIGLSPLGTASPPAVSDEQWQQGIGTRGDVVNPRKMEIGRQAGIADHGHAASRGSARSTSSPAKRSRTRSPASPRPAARPTRSCTCSRWLARPKSSSRSTISTRSPAARR